MSDPINHGFSLPPEQQAIRDKCFHPSGAFDEFPIEDVEQSILERFDQQVCKHPDRVAAKTRTTELTYNRLNKLANHLARTILTRRGVGQEPVALLLENDAPMIVSFLGVLKAGKIYVPLDPAYPISRLQYMLEDSGSALIISNGRNATLAKELSNRNLPAINIDEIEVTNSDESPALRIAPDAFAYIRYWCKPQLTREKFLPVGEDRLYLTGDLGLKRPDGCLLYRGRKDSQVKVRCNRIEIGEVEAALLDLENVCNAAVVVREDSPGERKLMAYIVPEKQPAPTATVLRRALRDRLPDFMVPAVFVFLNAMPVTPHGKLDRNALPDPDSRRPKLDAPFVVARSPVEQRLAGIWGDRSSNRSRGRLRQFLRTGWPFASSDAGSIRSRHTIPTGVANQDAV
jgi:acyl-coenzyme A synthetase/AMP-(fatty) acid ligase